MAFKDPSLFPGLALRYDFYAQTTGTTVTDGTGNGATYTRAASTAAGTWVNGGLQFDGVDDYGSAPVNPKTLALDGNRITIFGVANLDSTGLTQTLIRLLDDTTANWINFHPKWSGTTYVDFGNISTGRISTGTPPAAMFDAWCTFHIELSGTTLTLYVNGTSVLSGTVTPSFAATNNARTLLIGSSSGSGDFLKGILGAIYVYNESLSADDRAHQIGYAKTAFAALNTPITIPAGTSGSASSYTALAAPVDLYGFAARARLPRLYVTADEAAGQTNVKDFGSAGVGGAVVGGTTLGVSGGVRGDNRTGVKFNGTTGYLQFRNPQQLRIIGNITIILWMKVRSFPTGQLASIIGKDYDGANAGYQLRFQNVAGTITLEGGSYNGSNHYAVMTVAKQLLTRTWHHVALTHDGTAWRLYLDGVAVNTLTDSVGAVACTSDFVIGAGSVSGTVSRFADVSVDDVQLMASAMSAADILADFQLGDKARLAEKAAAWNALPLIASYHFAPATFLGVEIADGTAATSVVAPTNFSGTQIVAAGAASGARGHLVVVQHVDGMFMCPTGLDAYCTAVDYVQPIADAVRASGHYLIAYQAAWDNHWEAAHDGFTSDDATARMIAKLRFTLTKLNPDAVLIDGWGYYISAHWSGTVVNGVTTGYDVIRLDEVVEMVHDEYPTVAIIENNHLNVSNSEYTYPMYTEIPVWENGYGDGDIPAGNNLPMVMEWQTSVTDIDIGGTGQARWFFRSGQHVMTAAAVKSQRDLVKARGGVYNIGLTPDTTGQVPAAQVTLMQAVGPSRATNRLSLAMGIGI